MSIFRALTVEALDDEFRAYIEHHNAKLSYCQPMDFGSRFYDELQDRTLYRFDVLAMDGRRLDIGPERDGKWRESGKVFVRVFKSFNVSIMDSLCTNMRPQVLDLADPAVDPVETVRGIIRDFIYTHAITRSQIYISRWVVEEQR